MRPDWLGVLALAVELRFLVAPKRPEGADALRQRPVALGPRDGSMVCELLLVPSDADAELEPSGREPVEGRHLLGEGEEVPLEWKGDGRTDDEAVGCGG